MWKSRICTRHQCHQWTPNEQVIYHFALYFHSRECVLYFLRSKQGAMKRLNRQEAFRGSNSRPMISYDRTEFPRGKWFSATSERNFHKKSGFKLRLSGIFMKIEASGFQQRRSRISMRIENFFKRHFYTKPRNIKNKINKRDAPKAKPKQRWWRFIDGAEKKPRLFSYCTL